MRQTSSTARQASKLPRLRTARRFPLGNAMEDQPYYPFIPGIIFLPGPHPNDENNYSERATKLPPSSHTRKFGTLVLQDLTNRHAKRPPQTARTLARRPLVPVIYEDEKEGAGKEGDVAEDDDGFEPTPIRKSYRDACLGHHSAPSKKAPARIASRRPYSEENTPRMYQLPPPPTPTQPHHPLLHPRPAPPGHSIPALIQRFIHLSWPSPDHAYLQYLKDQAEHARKRDIDKTVKHYQMVVADTLLNRSRKRCSAGEAAQNRMMVILEGNKPYAKSPLSKELRLDAD